MASKIENDSPRGSIALSSSPVCYRRVKDKRPAPPSTVMRLGVFQFQATTSLKKCPESHKNQERIFVSGDSVGIIMNFDPFSYEGEVWFIVTKSRSGTKRLWRRQWSELRMKLDSVPQIAVEEVPVSEVGVVGEEAKVAHCLHVHNTECFCVKIGDGSRQNTLWVEVGLFDTRFVGTEEDYVKTVRKFPTYFPDSALAMVAAASTSPIASSPTGSAESEEENERDTADADDEEEEDVVDVDDDDERGRNGPQNCRGIIMPTLRSDVVEETGARV